jgi:hypothetical protein
MQFASLAGAKEEMVRLAKKTAVDRARRSGALHLDVQVDVRDREVKISSEDILYLETVITASVSSIPASKAVS